MSARALANSSARTTRCGQTTLGCFLKNLSKFLCLSTTLLAAACTQPLTTVIENDPEGLQRYYRAAEIALQNSGRLRTDYAPEDAPFSYDELVENFIRVALYDEYTVTNGRYVERQSPTHLRRWETPVRVATIFGESTPPEQRERDRAEIRNFTARLAGLTGLDMRLTDEASANMLVMVLTKPEQQAFAASLPDRFPNIDPAVVDAFMNSPINIFCAAFAFPVKGQPGVYGRSLILIKGEHGDLMRKSCIHEEMAQAMGLSNDSRSARPSIFNDDEEFAFLTLHDEILLRMLYDRRLEAGMTADQVRPLLPQIARDVADSY